MTVRVAVVISLLVCSIAPVQVIRKIDHRDAQ